MSPTSALRVLILSCGLAALAGCSAISSLGSAAAPLTTFELTPLPEGAARARAGRRHLEVMTPTATAALAGEGILVKPTPLQIATLPDARWVDEATTHYQLLVVRSAANTGRFALVTGDNPGPPPDYVLMTDLQAFQVEVGADGPRVEIASTVTLLRDTDERVLASANFAQSEPVADTSADLVAEAFDRAMTRHLTEVTRWLLRNAGG